MAKRRRNAARRPALGQVFASRSASMARENRAFRLWRESHNAGHLLWLEGPENYPERMPKGIARELRNFVVDWLNKRAVVETRIDAESKAMAGREGIGREKAYARAVEARAKDIERRFGEKAALDQIAWVLAHQKALMAGGKKVDPLEPGPNVRKLARGLKTARDKAAAFVDLVKRVSEIPLVPTHSSIAKAYYGLPTAEETLALKGILVGGFEGKAVWGCGMLCDVLNAVLTHAKWENFQARTVERHGHPHSIALARLPKTRVWLAADPYSDGEMFLRGTESFRGSNVVSQVGQYLGDEIEKLKRRGKWREGRCSGELVKSFSDFQRGN